MLNIRTLFIVCMILCSHLAQATPLALADTTKADTVAKQDIGDVYRSIFKKQADPEAYSKPKKVNLSVVPTLGYTLSTGFAIGLSGVATFYTQKNHTGQSSVVNAQVFYDSHDQQTFITQSNIWACNDQIKLVTDLRATKYPDVTYGLGNMTTELKADNIDYNYIRVYQTILKKVSKNFYAGGGYNLDYHFDITEEGNIDNTVSDFKRYGETSSSRSSGFNLTMLLDTRANPVNPIGGFYANAVYRDNLKALGSDSRWSTLQLDVRKYFRLSQHNDNVLAFWSYTWLTLSGRQPYLDLPSVGTDTYNNTGRGYAIDRFRGKNMLYLEGEYRFGLVKSGVLGGVLFASTQSYPRSVTANAPRLLPAGGAGVRIKINKHSNTNLCIDYGFGTDNSRGVFVNLGEVF